MGELAVRHRTPALAPFSGVTGPASRLAALLCALALFGCGTMKAYDGPEKPESEVAVVLRYERHDYYPFSVWGILPVPVPTAKHHTIVMKVDETAVSGVIEQIVVAPGRHSVSIAYSQEIPICGYGGCIITHSSESSITFMAEAGHKYRIPAEQRDERTWIWVEDIKTGTVVAGEKPPATPSE